MKKFIKILSVALIVGITFTSETIAFSASVPKSVYLGGETFGVRFYNDGVIVVGLEDYYDGQKYICPAKESGIEKNDIIKKINGTEIKTNENLQAVTVNSNGQKMKFEIERNGEKLEKEVTPLKNTAGMYLIGAWVRDSCAGIGTITYYDADSNYFGALGHGICDNDTNALLPLGYGEVVGASISSITKSKVGNAGSLNGYFTDNQIGNLTNNTNIGVFGTTNDNLFNKNKKIELAENNEIKTGDAEIFCTLEDDKIKSYDIEITRICNFDAKSNENFVIKITDSTLLDECGGIVQGMSGSPIVQNGKLVGAVTHVFVNRPNEGYGVAIQNMVSVVVE